MCDIMIIVTTIIITEVSSIFSRFIILLPLEIMIIVTTIIMITTHHLVLPVEHMCDIVTILIIITPIIIIIIITPTLHLAHCIIMLLGEKNRP